MFHTLSLNELLSLSDEERRRLLRTGWLFPISGAEGDDDDDEDEGDPSGAGDGDDDEDDADVLEISRADYNTLQAAARKLKKAQADKEKAEKSAAEQKKKDAGEYEELIADKDREIAELQAQHDNVAHEFDQFKRAGLVKEQARQFGFRNPEDAMANMTDEDTEDEASVTRALRRIARQKDYLVDPRKASGAPLNGAPGGQNGSLTIEQIKGMSESEVAERLPEVMAALEASGQN